VSQAVLFYLYATVAIAGALVLVMAKNLIHGAVGLLATLVAVGALFLLLGSEFLAAMQLFVYGGAITVLVMFALMLAGPRVNAEDRPTRIVYGVAGVVCALFFVGVGLVLLRTAWHVTAPVVHTTASIAEILFSRYVLPFEIAGLSLTIALIGVIVIAREDDVRGTGAKDPETPAVAAALSEEEGGLA
jgi:NADH:ubiquinone oxidoreductase subunit 6 (subunit J)